MLNQQVRHAIRRAEYEDIGINFIALPEFFEIPLSMLHEKNVLAEFIVGAFRQKDPVSHYLLFQLQEDPQVENLMENMIDSMLHEHANEDVINQYSMGLVFLLKTLFHMKATDAVCGFTFLKKEAAEQLVRESSQDNGWFYTIEFLLRAERDGMKIYDMPVEWQEDYNTTVKVWKTIKNYLIQMYHLKKEFRQEDKLRK